MNSVRRLILTATCGVLFACSPMTAAPVAPIPATPPATGAAATIAPSINGFGQALLARLAADNTQGNIFISPASIAAALTMAGNGAAGGTRQEMLATLGLSDLDAANIAWQQWLADTRRHDSGVTLNIANSLWSDNTFTPGADFLSLLNRCFSAPMTSLDFHDPASADRINGWVSDATGGKIPALVTPNILSNSVFCLINAVYFKGLWSTPFAPALTAAGDFTCGDGARLSVPLMTRTGDFSYAQTAGYQAVRLPYQGERYALYVFLPAAGSNPRALLPQLGGELFAGFSNAPGTLRLPRFKVEYEAVLNGQLAALGMPRAFTEQADFTPISPGLFISLVKHKAILEVNEQGSEAAAATLIAFNKTSLPEAPFTMTVDRPFLAVIRDETSGLPLFFGLINQPLAL